jgi:8-oxo-dGTP pyrophosphatase MutT (NUDIX family)
MGTGHEHPFNWRILSSRYLVRDRWLSLRADTCLTPSGLVVDPYYVIESPEYINVVPLTPAGEVVLAREYRHGLGRTTLELVGGAMEPGDPSPLETARRELAEETGYTSAHWVHLCALSPNAGRVNNLAHSYLALDVERTAAPALDETEQIEVVALPLAQVKSMLRENQIVQAMHASALFYALLWLEQHQPG